MIKPAKIVRKDSHEECFTHFFSTRVAGLSSLGQPVFGSWPTWAATQNSYFLAFHTLSFFRSRHTKWVMATSFGNCKLLNRKKWKSVPRDALFGHHYLLTYIFVWKHNCNGSREPLLRYWSTIYLQWAYLIVKFEMILPVTLTFHSSFHLSYLFGETRHFAPRALSASRPRCSGGTSSSADGRWIAYIKEKTKTMIVDNLNFFNS